MDEIIQKLKDEPQILDTMLEIAPDVMRPPTEAERQELYKTAIGLTAIVEKQYKEEVTAGLDKTLAGENTLELSKGANTLWEIILAAILLNPPQDVINTIADKLGYPAHKLEQIKNKALEEEKIEETYLPGLEPQEKRDRYPAPPYIFPKYTMIPTAELSRRIYNLSFQDTEAGALAEIGIDRRPHEHHIYMLMLDKLAENYPITAGDKNILIALGNLYGERKSAGNTGLQGGSIITAEDIGLAEPSMHTHIRELYQSFQWMLEKNDKKKSERLFLTQAVLMMVRCRKSRLVDWALNVAWDAHFETEMEIPDYAIDIHSRKGKAMGKTINNFLNEGSHLENHKELPREEEYKEWCRERWNAMEGKNPDGTPSMHIDKYAILAKMGRSGNGYNTIPNKASSAAKKAVSDDLFSYSVDE